MSLEVFYQEIKGDYQTVYSRLHSEALIWRLVIKFLDDPSYERLCNAIREEDYEAAFMAVHTLKGVCQNLNFQVLTESAGQLTELLRNWADKQVDKESCNILLKQVENDYKMVVDAVRRLEEVRA